MTRSIIHIDLDAFFCAVEEILNPDLQGKPFAVGGLPDQRGVVSSCSYAARKFGVHSAMPMAKAKRICPNLIIIKPKFKVYEQVSINVMQILSQFTPLIEQISIDEAFLDISDQADKAGSIARQIQGRVKEEYQLPASLGIASNKMVAKIATDYGKSRSTSGNYPNAITIVPPGTEKDFLAPLPVLALIGVGPKTAARMEELGIQTIGDLSRHSESVLIRSFGKFGHELYLHSRGIDDRPIITSHKVKSISNEITFAKDISDDNQLKTSLRDLTHRVCQRLGKNNLKGSTIRLKLRWEDFTTITRQVTLESPTDREPVIYPTVIELFESCWRTKQPIRLLGVGVSNFDKDIKQLGLWNTAKFSKEEKLYEVLQELEDRYGNGIVRRGTIIGLE